MSLRSRWLLILWRRNIPGVLRGLMPVRFGAHIIGNVTVA